MDSSTLSFRFRIPNRNFRAVSAYGSVLLVVGLVLAAAFPVWVRAEVSGSLVIVGNGPELTTIESLSRAFEKANPRAYVDVIWDDHSKPVEMVKSGEANIAVTGSEDSSLSAK